MYKFSTKALIQLLMINFFLLNLEFTDLKFSWDQENPNLLFNILLFKNGYTLKTQDIKNNAGKKNL